MAILWAESFDLYGTSLPALGLRGYSEFSGTAMTLPNSAPAARTGVGYLNCASTSAAQRLSRTLDAPVNVLGLSGAIAWLNLPGNETNRGLGFRVGTAANADFIVMNGNGSQGIDVYLGGVLVGSTAPNIWTLSTWYFYELKVTNNTFGGGLNTSTIEVRDSNGNTLLLVTGLNITVPFTRWTFGKTSTSGFTSIGMKYDDLIVWDDSTSFNNDFLGDRRCETMFPNADGPNQNWIASTPPAWDCINEATPSDVDYIQAGTVGDISDFTKTPIGIATNDIAAIVHIGRMLKTDAGPSSVKLGVQSGAFVDNGPDLVLTTSAAYYQHIVQRDPNGSVAWTKAAADAALLRYTRSI